MFQGCSGLTSVDIPNSVTDIGMSAFRDCCGLSSIVIPTSVINIRGDAFKNCSGLKSVYISDITAWCKISFEDLYSNPLYLARHLYLGDEEIKDLTIPQNVTSIGQIAFAGCSGLSSVIIPNNIVSIGREAFFYCSGLSSITIPNSITSIESGVFQGCSGLTSVDIPNNLTVIGEVAFEMCTSLTSVIIPNSVTSLGNGAFAGCSNLTTVTIGSGTKEIWNQAFENCKELADVYCLATNVPYTVGNAFDGSYIEYVTLHVPESSINSYGAVEPWKNFKNIVKIDKPKHKLTYMINEEIFKTYEKEEGESITPEPEPTKEGYTFSGWSEIPETMPAHDVTVTGSFSINSYKLTYIVDGDEYKSYQIDYGTSIAAENEPTKEGYTFSGWSEIPETMPAHDVTVTGNFTINSYTLTYMVDDEVYKTYELKYGTDIIPEEAPQKTGYTFSGWSDIPSTMPAKDITISGTFIINSYKLTYVVDGVEYKTFEVEYDSAITPEEEPTKEGHTFSGWSEIPETMPANDVTVTGSFIVNKYQVTYIIEGEVFATDYVEYGATIVPPTVDDKEGYTFDGWVDVPETMPAHDITIYGGYTSGIAEIFMANQRNVRIYSPNGKKIGKLQKGLNVVVLEDGNVKKIIVR